MGNLPEIKNLVSCILYTNIEFIYPDTFILVHSKLHNFSKTTSYVDMKAPIHIRWLQTSSKISFPCSLIKIG